MRATNAWYDEPEWAAQQVIPDNLARPCSCSAGQQEPVEGTDDFGSDGTALIDTECTAKACRISSVAYWTWPTGDAPAETPGYGEEE